MVLRISGLVAACALLAGACSALGLDGADVVRDSPKEISIEVGYDAAVEGVDARAKAASHCGDYGKNAVWYGHDRDGNLHFKCE
jgi:hypothetical protein